MAAAPHQSRVAGLGGHIHCSVACSETAQNTKGAVGQLEEAAEKFLGLLTSGKWLLVGSYGIFLIALFRGNRGLVELPEGEVGEVEWEAEKTTREGLKRKKEEEERDLLLRNNQQESRERREASDTVQRYVGRTTKLFCCEDMGSRLQKNWMCVWAQSIVTAAPLPKHCVLTLDTKTLQTLNKITTAIKHPHILPVVDIGYDSGSGLVITTQYRQGGSLRDLVYQQPDSTLDRAVKYPTMECEDTYRLPIDDVKAYGRQILEAVAYLYRQGFPQLGHIQTGNIFVALSEDGKRLVDPNVFCRVGGYESTLLGYRSRLFRSIESAGHPERIDVIMFGHVIYELACGRELQGAIPKGAELHCDTLEANPKLQKVLEEIFELKVDNVDQILKSEFFADAKYKSGEEGTLPEKLRRFLSENYGQQRSRGFVGTVSSMAAMASSFRRWLPHKRTHNEGNAHNDGDFDAR